MGKSPLFSFPRTCDGADCHAGVSRMSRFSRGIDSPNGGSRDSGDLWCRLFPIVHQIYPTHIFHQIYSMVEFPPNIYSRDSADLQCGSFPISPLPILLDSMEVLIIGQSIFQEKSGLTD